MESIVGIFASRIDARRAYERIRSIGVIEEHLSLLLPGETEREIHELQTDDTEQTGAAKVLGSIVGGATGLTLGPLATAAVTALIPGIGPIAVIGAAAAALFGVGGGFAGAKIGEKADHAASEGLPRDEVFIYEDALRQGRSVVVAMVNDKDIEDEVRDVLREEGAEAIDEARKRWWLGVRDAEREHYTVSGRDFDSDETIYRHGFEAALHMPVRGRDYSDARDYLKQAYPGEYEQPAFRSGYDRGCEHFNELCSRYGREAG